MIISLVKGEAMNVKRPFLLRFAEKRNQNEKSRGSYSYSRDVWMVREHGGYVPLISSQSNVPETKTKTFIARERED